MKKWKLSFFACLFVILSACTPMETGEREEEQVKEQEEKKEGKAMLLLKKDLEWMAEQNQNLHSPTDSHILSYDDREPIGQAVYYDNRGEFDTNRYPFHVAFHGKHYQFDLGWTGPNQHTIDYKELTESVRERRIGDFYEPFYPFIDDWGGPKEGTDWQITAADIDGDGVLEIIVTARRVDPEELVSNEKIMAIYYYTDDVDNPFELAVHLQFSNKSSNDEERQKFLFTAANEWVGYEWGEETVLAYLEDGDWYIDSNYYLPYEENLSTAYLRTSSEFDEKPEYTRLREPGNYLKTRGGQEERKNKDVNTKPIVPEEDSDRLKETTVPRKSEMELEGVLKDIEESCQYADDSCEPLSDEDIKERAGLAAVFYVEKSIIARKLGDYELAEPYIVPNSPIAEDMKNLVPNDASRGVSMNFEEFEILDVVDLGKDEYHVYLRNTYDIQGTKSTGLRTFESILQVNYNPALDEFQAYELVKEREI